MKKRGANIYWAPTVFKVCDKSLTSNIFLFSQSIKVLTVIIIPTLWVKKYLLDLNWPWKTDWFKTGKEVSQGCILVTLLIEFICRVHHVKCQAGWITSWNQDCQEKYQQLQICIWYHPMAENQEELKSLLMRVKGRRVKSWLKLNIKKTKIMASHHIMVNKREKVEAMTDFYFLELQNHCRWWIRPWN